MENLAAPRFCSQAWRLRPREWDSRAASGACSVARKTAALLPQTLAASAARPANGDLSRLMSERRDRLVLIQPEEVPFGEREQ
jgi:hypothetical protein